MRLLIDGYNLLHATDLFGAGELAGTLRGSREALVAFLATRLTEKERRATVIVFDAADAPPGLPDRYEQHGIDVRFARDYPDADAMIEAILESVRGARELTVVSGDKRVQRAARSRGARPVESADWFADLCRRPTRAELRAERKPTESVGSHAEWIDAFSDPEALDQIAREAASSPPPKPAPPEREPSPAGPEAEPATPRRTKRRRRPPLSESAEKPRHGFGAGLENPFPPGYGEDLLPPTDPPIDADRHDRDERDA